MVDWTRRDFLRGAGGMSLSLSLAALVPWAACREAAEPPARSAAPPAPLAPVRYGSWADLYRERLRYDSVHKGTHFVNCWYQRGCNWNVYVKDGVVFREEQVGSYEQTNAEVPDFNPRGCQKGACYSERLLDASRLRHPLRRVGERGSGRFRRISWDEGLREIAGRSLDALIESGPASIVWDPGTANANGGNGIGVHRTGFVLDTPVLNVNCEVGDHHPGAMATLGKISFASSADDLFYSDLILIWGGNPTYTQIPNAHFINEARYKGAQVVCIAPDYSASAVHADLWLPVEVGSDAALGLSMAQVIVEEGLYDADFIREQSDLPLLVRSDTQRFLRESDLEPGGADDVFHWLDAASGELRKAGRRSLALAGVEPLLEARRRIALPGGEVEVRTVFDRLRERLADYVPEAAEAITGTPAPLVRALARRLAKARAATLITQSNFSKFYHGLEMERAQILVFTLCGQLGRKGAGINGFPSLGIAGPASAIVSSGSLSPSAGALLLAAKMTPSFLRQKLDGYSDEMIVNEATREEYRQGGHLSGALYHLVSGGLESIYGDSARWDPHLKRPLSAYYEEAVAQGWQVAPADVRPRVFFEVGGNILRRTRGYDRLQQPGGLLDRLDLLVTLDWHMSNTALHSDYVFPAAAWYEKDDITWATPIAPFAHVTTRAVAPLAEAKSDWEFHCLFLEALQRQAGERGVREFSDRAGRPRRLDRVYDDFTFGRRYREDNPEDLLRELLSMTTNLGDIGWDELKSKGFERYTGLGMDFVNLGNATDIEPGETITANTWHVRDKLPWPTLTRRMQFYIDHPFYLELGEALPVHKDPPAVGGELPLRMTGQHARWSIHASWRDTTSLLRLQRGEPVVVLGRRDAEQRGISDAERVRIWNELGSFEALARISDSLRPGQIIVNHAWEPYQFAGHKSHQSLTGSPLNPIQLAGGYFHLQPTPLFGEPGTHDRGTRVEVEKRTSGA